MGETRTCPVCGREHDRRYSDGRGNFCTPAKYCSPECGKVAGQRYNRERAIKAVAAREPEICPVCGKEHNRMVGNKRSKYCSPECGKKAGRDAALRRIYKNDAPALPVVDPYPDESRTMSIMREKKYFPPLSGRADWRDANFCPLG